MNTEMKMPFGKHYGVKICDLPTSYVHWLAENCNDEDICEAADEEYRSRKDHGELE